jgi:hypothetical protein
LRLDNHVPGIIYETVLAVNLYPGKTFQAFLIL